MANVAAWAADSLVGFAAGGESSFNPWILRADETGELGFEHKYLTLATHCNCTGIAWFSSHFCKFIAVWHCNGICSALPICAEKMQKIFGAYFADCNASPKLLSPIASCRH
jgi:hypothetical protein